MGTKVKLKEFLNLSKCQKFVNDFCENNWVLKKKIIPIANVGSSNIVFFVFLEYYSNN